MTGGTELIGLIRASKWSDPTDVPEMIVAAVADLGAADVIVYVVDFEHEVLEPLPDRSSHAELPHPEDVGTTIAGRAFLQCRPATAERPDGTRVWVPIVEGSNPTGVLALTVPEADDATVATCEDLGILTGYLIAVQSRVTDLYNLHRRRKAMSLAASMQWDLLPPLTLASRRVVASGLLEPAYEVGGDCFDYSLNGPQLDVAVMDSMGHGLHSAMLAGLAVGCYRHDRREGRMLEHIHASLDAVIAAECGGEGFVTGHIGRLNLNTGSLQWVNAGHPPPMLVRHGRVVRSLDGPPARPWGLGPADAEVMTSGLEPGDSILFYTDGVTEARGHRQEAFGVSRLADLVGQHASDQLPIGLIVRLLTRAVLDHHGGQLHDDATVLMVNWPGPVDDPGFTPG